MAYVLVVITVFTSAQGITTSTRFHEFTGREACEIARAGIERGIYAIKGQVGREAFTACYAKASRHAR